jgi:hypothetical protein
MHLPDYTMSQSGRLISVPSLPWRPQFLIFNVSVLSPVWSYVRIKNLRFCGTHLLDATSFIDFKLKESLSVLFQTQTCWLCKRMHIYLLCNWTLTDSHGYNSAWFQSEFLSLFRLGISTEGIDIYCSASVELTKNCFRFFLIHNHDVICVSLVNCQEVPTLQSAFNLPPLLRAFVTLLCCAQHCNIEICR